MKGVLFKAEKVRWILDWDFEKQGNMQTRRIVKPQPTNMQNEKRRASVLSDSRYKKGETVYLKETWCDPNNEGLNIFYKADCPFYYTDGHGDRIKIENGQFKWKNKMFMPEWASRHKLKIVDVRVERLKSISVGNIEKEGIKKLDDRYSDITMITRFMRLWDSINKEYTWESNPYVFVYEFKKEVKR